MSVCVHVLPLLLLGSAAVTATPAAATAAAGGAAPRASQARTRSLQVRLYRSTRDFFFMCQGYNKLNNTSARVVLETVPAQLVPMGGSLPRILNPILITDHSMDNSV